MPLLMATSHSNSEDDRACLCLSALALSVGHQEKHPACKN